MRSILLTLALAACVSPAAALELKGPTGQTATVSAADLADLPRVSFTFDAHGQKATYEGPLLIDVLAKVGAPTGKALRGPALANAVIVKASDGYTVVYGLAELDPGTRANRIILADKADGAPLGAKDGPFKVVAEGDVRPARSARLVTSIEVRDLGGGSGTAHKH
ncbi:MAG: molybdopterin-binding oxidoreductase [Phenylobacterium zucineum]|nr:MAG: molybdopterin-binding oxidoreductase [Phenylobacterium zucineum]